MSAEQYKTKLAQELNDLESEYQTKYKAYIQMGDTIGWRGARAWLDHLEDCVKSRRSELKQLGVVRKTNCIVAHN